MTHTPGPWWYDEHTECNGSPAGWVASLAYRERKSDIPFGDQRDDGALIASTPDLLATCEVVAARPAEAQEMMRREGFVIDDLEDRWQKLAFTLYTYLAANATQAEAAIATAKGEQ